MGKVKRAGGAAEVVGQEGSKKSWDNGGARRYGGNPTSAAAGRAGNWQGSGAGQQNPAGTTTSRQAGIWQGTPGQA